GYDGRGALGDPRLGTQEEDSQTALQARQDIGDEVRAIQILRKFRAKENPAGNVGADPIIENYEPAECVAHFAVTVCNVQQVGIAKGNDAARGTVKHPLEKNECSSSVGRLNRHIQNCTRGLSENRFVKRRISGAYGGPVVPPRRLKTHLADMLVIPTDFFPLIDEGGGCCPEILEIDEFADAYSVDQRAKRPNV